MGIIFFILTNFTLWSLDMGLVVLSLNLLCIGIILKLSKPVSGEIPDAEK